MRFKLNPKSIAIIAVFVVYSLFVFINYDAIVGFISESGLVVGLLAYFLFNPAYMLIFIGIYMKYSSKMAWKRVIAGMLTIISLDMLAIPRLALSESLYDGSAVSTNIGAIIMKSIESLGISHTISYTFMYLILPVIGLIISVELLGVTDWVKNNVKKAI